MCDPAGIKNESPDVETPGLLVKALISSFFIMRMACHPINFFFYYSKYSRLKAYEQELAVPLLGYFLFF
jgi:hypothetical protein